VGFLIDPLLYFRKEVKAMSFEEDLRNECFTLALCQSLTPQEKGALLLECFSDSECSFLEWAREINVSEKKKADYRLFKETVHLIEEYKKLDKYDVKWITIFDSNYPWDLRHIYAAPLVLFYKGDSSLLNSPSLAVVGARACTNYGIRAVRSLLPELIHDKWVIVSGLAKGLDTEAHNVAIQFKGKTIGVIGTGLDYCYPKENQELQYKMAKEHLVVTEYPLGVGPKRHHFPFRNRIIAGLSKGLLVIEAQERSGSLITARMALDNGREVFAVPGSIFNPCSVGCNQLIQLGAKSVLTTGDIMEELRHKG
jgi:DNA processing protein